MESRKVARVVNFAPVGINRWLSKVEGGVSPMITMLFKQGNDTNLSFLAPKVEVVRWSRISRRRGVLSKKSRSWVMEGSSGDG